MQARKLLWILEAIHKDIPYKPKEVKTREAPKRIPSQAYTNVLPTSKLIDQIKAELAGYNIEGRQLSDSEDIKRYELQRKLLMLREIEKGDATAKRSGFFHPDLGGLDDEDLELIIDGPPGVTAKEKDLQNRAKEELNFRKQAPGPV